MNWKCFWEGKFYKIFLPSSLDSLVTTTFKISPPPFEILCPQLFIKPNICYNIYISQLLLCPKSLMYNHDQHRSFITCSRDGANFATISKSTHNIVYAFVENSRHLCPNFTCPFKSCTLSTDWWLGGGVPTVLFSIHSVEICSWNCIQVPVPCIRGFTP